MSEIAERELELAREAAREGASGRAANHAHVASIFSAAAVEATLNNFLIEQHGAGRKVLLIVDEAQNLSLRVLEEIRLLSGVETTKEKVLRIIVSYADYVRRTVYGERLV